MGRGKAFAWSFMDTHPTPFMAMLRSQIIRTYFPWWSFMGANFFSKTFPKLRNIFEKSENCHKNISLSLQNGFRYVDC